MTTALRIHKLNKHFANGKHALRDINLEIRQGEMVALIGASGSGKSTLLRHVAGLVVADAGEGSLIEIDGCCVQQGGRVHRDIRKVRSQIGFVFQQFNLVDRLPVMANVLVGRLHRMPLWRSLTRWFNAQERAMAIEALARVGIAECHAQRASTLSGGQQQRAAIARTLVQGAKVVLADEPIASLDPESSRKVMEILTRINREDGSTVVVSLHQVDMALKYCPRVIALHQGQVVFDGAASALTPALLRELYGMQADEMLMGEPQAHAPIPLTTAPERHWPTPLAQAA
ncbi:MAG TPA: phosphonate ABC transporter ATP-binding protein [Hydrogenophaga sp.]|jgi:phosphonate transport system ATP-binding protein|uniref:phosphonate ABC transporter ATP-binding protein n=1 Tax=Hydrogenophaga sp. TaxID=1904254 RepID=UPI0008BE764F|nr:phosphonate ABC transporter ATP-binding protein [Hydrogenophaga sp.]MBU4180407.1 phosphonate ABC transporter ATP-binding protein [Gammaproteobacteria bacterium]MBW8469067.1 phosphonate ABC transporter ATP-binding protein [Thiobacillus sp.]OGA78062.1 MAG: phosphonate ABC transporter ATP-binding protein [Burkholderiales bacterium GWE1_65_30]OGA94413.1 MAG: phosphonate ABC transporter ATP-binding protein [Burkholderiales bacterium GWF1_66_17]OGB28151.1 MAG: phosphonate ABC transporter ATP-bind